ncbi:MAG: MBL fold metallo-hydrolase [Opitutus sp.]|nr:MBL fold metallo-hydrolase [Betaproteobacteria bacterium]MSU23323.1 MBL fold metallo-hydrolase [Opitutus sp.]
MFRFPRVGLFVLLGISGFGAEPGLPAPAQVKSLKITILSTMLADRRELGEWGFAALVEADGHRILFDTGKHTDVVRRNAESLKIDLTTVPDVVLSHSHDDHTGGFLTLRRSVMTKAPGALARTHVGLGIFYPRAAAPNAPMENRMLAIKSEYESTGGVFLVCEKPVQLFSGVWLTGPVARQHPERNWSGSDWVTAPAGRMEDNLPEDIALVCDTANGLVVLTGCGHAGVINTIESARAVVRPARVHALVGGIHLFNATDETLKWTGDRLREFGLDHLLGAHCTGIETVYRLRHDLVLDRAHAVVGAVGAAFELGRGIAPGQIAK